MPRTAGKFPSVLDASVFKAKWVWRTLEAHEEDLPKRRVGCKAVCSHQEANYTGSPHFDKSGRLRSALPGKAIQLRSAVVASSPTTFCVLVPFV